MRWLLLLLLAVSCTTKTIVQQDDPDLVTIQLRTNELKLASVNIMDRNGLSETISAKERLKNFENVNFLTTQPYQKVLRVYAKEKNGNSLSIITSYYPSGQIRQHLECLNGRASGKYHEWHPNGKKKLLATILGGAADLDDKSQTTWVFHEISHCWNEDGTLIAEMPYSQGLLEGIARYYHPTGKPSEEIPYHKGEIDGETKVLDENGTLVETTCYLQGVKSGPSRGFWEDAKVQWDEKWLDDLLQEGTYYDQAGEQICQVVHGNGKRCIFSESSPSEIQEYVSGSPEGEVLVYNDSNLIARRLRVKDGEKHGEEIYYWPTTPTQPKLAITWLHGQIHGTVKTWYEDGTPESTREMSHNQKQGMLTAWYKDGKLMLIEEYEKDRLVRGDYLKHGDSKAITQIIDGKGVATFYDQDGTFRARVSYEGGKPTFDDLLSER